MSAQKTIQLNCDGQIGECAEVLETYCERIPDARREARTFYEWRFIRLPGAGSYDLCPECASDWESGDKKGLP